jgi:hypothetical protein
MVSRNTISGLERFALRLSSALRRGQAFFLRCAPMVFGFILECRSDSFQNERSASSESPAGPLQAKTENPSIEKPKTFLAVRESRARTVQHDRSPKAVCSACQCFERVPLGIG